MRAHATSCYEGGRTSNRAALLAVPASLESFSHDALRLRLAAGGTGSAPIATTETTAGEGAAVAVSFPRAAPNSREARRPREHSEQQHRTSTPEP